MNGLQQKPKLFVNCLVDLDLILAGGIYEEKFPFNSDFT